MKQIKFNHHLVSFALVFCSFFAADTAFAATLQITPSTGVYTTGAQFTVKILVNTEGKPINAAEGTIKFNPSELAVVSVNRSSSIFNLWVAEPTFSNSAGTINFSGGMPSGYTGNSGNIFSITFRPILAGTTRVSYTTGAVLANDGMGTNVLSGMNGGTFTIHAPTEQPKAEVVEYVPPANTPGSPVVTSKTHPIDSWSNMKDAVLSWVLPSGVTGVRTLLDSNSAGVPTKVYEPPIKDITLEDLPEGKSYFHIQFRNADGWGRVTHYQLGVDTQKPTDLIVLRDETVDVSSPEQRLIVSVKDVSSKVKKFIIKINNNDSYEFIDEKETGLIPLSSLTPGHYAVLVDAYDEAGNSIVGSVSFDISSFEVPKFTEYPSEINEEVIPVLRGMTRPNSTVTVTVRKLGTDSASYTVMSNEAGQFTFIPETTFKLGVYELTAQAVDSHGAQSGVSEPIRIAVQQPGFVKIGEVLISFLSIVVPLVGMTALLILTVWWMIFYVRRLRGRVSVESKEALDILTREFAELQSTLISNEEILAAAKKSKKLTKAEEDVFASLHQALYDAQERVRKEVEDVENLVNRKSALKSSDIRLRKDNS